MEREQFISEISEVQESLRRFLLALCGGDRMEAEDIAQEALVKAYIAMDGVASIIADRLRETFKYWESDNNVLNDRLDDFIECYGEDVFLDPTNDTLVEIKKMDTWDFY